MKKKILVAGGTGYIGSHTAVELINAGYEVLIIDDLSNSSIEVLDGIEKITGVRPAFSKVHSHPQKVGTLGYFLRSSASFSGLRASPLRRPHRGHTSPITPT